MSLLILIAIIIIEGHFFHAPYWCHYWLFFLIFTLIFLFFHFHISSPYYMIVITLLPLILLSLAITPLFTYISYYWLPLLLATSYITITILLPLIAIVGHCRYIITVFLFTHCIFSLQYCHWSLICLRFRLAISRHFHYASSLMLGHWSPSLFSAFHNITPSCWYFSPLILAFRQLRHTVSQYFYAITMICHYHYCYFIIIA